MSVRGYKCRLRVILAEKDIRHGVFAEKVGIGSSTLSAIINSKRLPSFEYTYAILAELEMKIDEVWVMIENEAN
ncbi:helix-turn-helix domain-containing protein [Evansella tamaricis]|uniref:Helix-turn-helix transcriptional regulator n=1 Tax=Evansella tamaricis TaxID=2069301 RepID=A0ABS6JFC4_9BACI|nr:helix-turn-helix transcriptional regulator [Evansella tamaricis]MBU9711038.1 helix-turn-helix transcriptional regulator [Evansella tamaricis]